MCTRIDATFAVQRGARETFEIFEWIELALQWKSQTAPSIEVFDRSTINPLDITKARSSRGVNFLLEHIL